MARYIRYQVRNYLHDEFLEPWGQCDLSGQMFPRSQLARQMIQSGDDVTWSGFWVFREYLDPLNEQLKPPPVKADPKPVRYPRPNTSKTNPGDMLIYPDASGGSFVFPPLFSNDPK